MSDADVESYKQIKSDLDVLRQSVEKSELWVYKSNKPTTTTVASGTQQHNNGAENQLQKAPEIISTPSTQPTAFTLPQMTDIQSTTLPLTTTDKEPGDTSTTESIDGGEEELDEEEEDEYKKIQKVMYSFNCVYLIRI